MRKPTIGIIGAATAHSIQLKLAGGEVWGILPSPEDSAANPYVTIAIATNMGHSRNIIIAHTAVILIAIGGEFGTLSELTIALTLGKTVISLGS